MVLWYHRQGFWEIHWVAGTFDYHDELRELKIFAAHQLNTDFDTQELVDELVTRL